VVVRAKNEAESIGEVLALVNDQQLGGRGCEVIVVDSGSTDGTQDIARSRGATLIEIPPESFTFGGSLNTGAEAARAPVIVALSAHAFPPDRDWLGRMLAWFDDPRVACCYGVDNAPAGGTLEQPVVQDEEHARRFWSWGYGNGAGAFRADLWRQRPFRTDMPGTEDREWAWYWIQRGHVAAIDPALRVKHEHSNDPLRDIYRRFHREWVGYTMYLDLPPYGVRGLLREWWFERQGWPNHFRARLSPSRIAQLLGTYAGRRGA
jgi:rhamnosyltransferase